MQQRQAHLERSRVERHQHVRRIPRGRDRIGADVHLVRRHAEGRAHGRPNLRREVRKGREVLAALRGRGDELRTHQLHAVAGVPGKANDDRVHRQYFRHTCLVPERVCG